MHKVVIKHSTVTGIHQTKIASCEEVVLQVVRDDSIPDIDPHCMKVMFPLTVPAGILTKVTQKSRPKSTTRPTCSKMSGKEGW